MKYILFLLTLATTFCQVQGQLSFPVLNSQMHMDSSGAKKDIYFYPSPYYQVRAADQGHVSNIYNVDSNFTIGVQVKYKIYYQNLRKVSVKNDEDIKTGQLIGELFISKDIPQAEALIIRVIRGQKCVFDSTFFKQ